MRPSGIRQAIAVASLVVAITGLVGQSSAQSSPVLAASNAPSRGPASMAVTGTKLSDLVTVFLQAGESPNEGTYSVTDPNGVTAGPNCVARSATEVVCTQFSTAAFNDEFVAVLGGQNDVFRFEGDLHQLRLYGGDGSDRLDGSGARDLIYGEAGGDILRGHGGADRIDAGLGRDGVNSGSGSDRLYMHDGERDRRIACGPGHDVAHIDAELDPKPHGCERIVDN